MHHCLQFDLIHNLQYFLLNSGVTVLSNVYVLCMKCVQRLTVWSGMLPICLFGIKCVPQLMYIFVYLYLDHSCNKYCDVIGQEEVSISHKYL